jgi:bacterial/archaeal transporter family-2 protein
MSNLLAIGLILLVGGISAIQVGMNGLLGHWLGHPLRAAFANFSIGTMLLGVVLAGFMATQGMGLPTAAQVSAVPWYGWFGGLCGACFVLSTIILAPQVGASTFAACIIAGQLAVAAVLDHYGWLGFSHHPMGLERWLGIGLLLAGVWLIQR